MIIDSLEVDPILERLRLVQNGSSEIPYVLFISSDSHIRGHIFPRTTGARLTNIWSGVLYGYGESMELLA